MARSDPRSFITVHDGMPDHPKVGTLSDKAFRLLVESWCWCSRHQTDGVIPAKQWKRSATPRAREELIKVGLVNVANDHFVMHDYLKHQASKSDREKRSGNKRKAVSKANHNRWHEARGLTSPDCQHCPAEGSQTDHGCDSSEITERSQNLTEVEVEVEEKIDGSSRGAPYVSSGPAPRGQGSSAAFQLVLRTIGHDITSNTRTALAFEVQRLMPEVGEPTIVDALQRWNNRSGIGPKMLPGLVDDIRKEARGATTHAAPALVRPSTTDQRVAAAQALKARLATNGANVLQLPSGDHR